MTIAAARPHIKAVIDALEAAELAVGDGEAPDPVPDPVKYCVVYGIPGGRNFGTLENPFEDAEIPVQVNCVGGSRWQADWLRDEVVEILCAGFEVPNRSISRVEPIGQPNRDRDDLADPPVFVSMQRFMLRSTPAPA